VACKAMGAPCIAARQAFRADRKENAPGHRIDGEVMTSRAGGRRVLAGDLTNDWDQTAMAGSRPRFGSRAACC